MTSREARRPPLLLVIYVHGENDYRDHLNASGFRVEEAHSGAQGFERAVALQPDLIVLDFGLDGNTVAQLRSEPATREIPILALSDLAELHGRRRAATSADAAES